MKNEATTITRSLVLLKGDSPLMRNAITSLFLFGLLLLPHVAASKDEPFFPVKVRDTWGYMDKTGKIVIPAQFDHASEFSDGLAKVTVSGKAGFIDPQGTFAINPQFNNASSFSEGLACVYTDSGCGFITKAGDFAIPPNFERAESFSDGLAPVCQKNRWGFVDKHGTVVIALQFSRANGFSEGLAWVGIGGAAEYSSTAGKWGCINKAGKLVINPRFGGDVSSKFIGGLAPARVGDSYGFIDTKGNIAVNAEFKEVRHFSEGLCGVAVRNNKGWLWGYIDQNGREVIGPQFGATAIFSEGLAAVRVGDHTTKWGYVDRTGKMVIEPQFRQAEPFRNGLAMVEVELDGNWAYIDTRGQIISPQ